MAYKTTYLNYIYFIRQFIKYTYQISSSHYFAHDIQIPHFHAVSHAKSLKSNHSIPPWGSSGLETCSIDTVPHKAVGNVAFLLPVLVALYRGLPIAHSSQLL